MNFILKNVHYNRGWWPEKLKTPRNTLSSYNNFSHRDKMANFMLEIVTFLSSAFRITGHKYFADADKEFIYSFYIF